MACKVAAFMGPDELVRGTLTGVRPRGNVIALPGIAPPTRHRQLSIGEAFERSVRARR